MEQGEKSMDMEGTVLTGAPSPGSPSFLRLTDLSLGGERYGARVDKSRFNTGVEQGRLRWAY